VIQAGFETAKLEQLPTGALFINYFQKTLFCFDTSLSLQSNVSLSPPHTELLPRKRLIVWM
jgi:hypothetical protein